MAKSNKRNKSMVREALTDTFLTRGLTLASNTIDVEAGTVEATLASDSMVRVYDPESRQVIDEVLVAAGGRFPERTPLLNNHDVESPVQTAILGGASNFRREGSLWAGRLQFDIERPSVKEIFGQLARGFINNLSIGYKVVRSVIVPAGTSRTIEGLSYRASASKNLRVVLEWVVREVSLVAVGADANARIRSGEGSVQMNQRLLSYLRSLGLAETATTEEAQAFLAGLSGMQRSIAGLLNYTEGSTEEATRADNALRAWNRDPSNPINVLRTETDPEEDEEDEEDDAPNGDEGGEHGRRSDSSTNAVVIERQRISDIRRAAQLAGEAVEEQDVNQAIEEGWEVARAQRHFLERVNDRRSNYQRGSNNSPEMSRVDQMLAANYGPAVRSLSRAQTHSANVLSLALANRDMRSEDSYAVMRRGSFQRIPREGNDDLERNLDFAYERRGISMFDVAREALRMNGISEHLDGPEALFDALRSSPNSVATLTGIYSNAFAAQFMAGFDFAVDTTGPITTESSHNDFRTTEHTRLAAGLRMTRHARGGEAEHTSFSDATESYKIARYSRQFRIDDQDVIDDRFGSTESGAASELGEAAKQLRPDLVYATLFRNDNMRDGVALFHASHSNLNTSSAISRTNIQTGITKINTATENGRLLSSGPGFVIVVPENLSFTADGLISSPVVSNDSGAGNKNTLLARSIQMVQDARLDLGLVDPTTDSAIAHLNTTWYMAKSNSRHLIQVAYLRGNRGIPGVEPFTIPGGGWGMGWKIKLDIGAKPMDWRVWQKFTA